MTSPRLPRFGICAPSSYARPEKFLPGLEKLRALSHELIVHPQAHGRLDDTQLAGTPQDRVAALYDLMADSRVDIVLTAAGGNGALQLVDKIDYTRLTKPIIGYSDTTALLTAAFAKTGRVQYHGPAVNWFWPEWYNQEIYEQTLTVLDGTAQTLPTNGARVVRPGTGTGPLIGGNITVFQHLLHTPYCPNLTGAVLFFEDIGAELSSLDRQLNYFSLLGVLKNAAGLVFGQFTDMLDTGRPFRFTVDQMIDIYTQNLDIPVIKNAPFGHGGVIPTYPIGATVTLHAQEHRVQLNLK